MKSFFVKRNYIIAALVMFASLDWLLLPVPIVNKHIAVVPSEILLLVFFYCFVYTKHINGVGIRNLYNSRYLKNIMCFLGIYIISTGYHIATKGFDIQFFMPIRYILAGIITYLIFIKLKLNIKNRYNALLFVLTIINLIRLYKILQGEVVRTSPFMVNIIIYITFIQICYPIILYFIFERSHILSNVERKISFLNLIFIIVISPFSGSRTCNAVLIVINIIFALYLIVRRKKTEFYKFLFLLLSSVAILVCCTAFTRNAETRSYVLRAYGLDKIITTTATDISRIDKDSLTQKVGTISFFEEKEENGSEVVIRESDQVRSYYWNTAISLIRENPIIGNGSSAIEYNGTFQSPHNFILELLLSFGMLGTFFAIKILFYPLASILKSKFSVGKFYSLLISFAFFFVSLFQPTLMTVSLVIVYYYCINILILEEKLEET